MTDEYLTLQEIAKRWKISKDSVRRIFQREAGVLFINATRNNTVNGRRSIRVPIAVYERVLSSMEHVV